jgi:type III secretion protein L
MELVVLARYHAHPSGERSLTMLPLQVMVDVHKLAGASGPVVKRADFAALLEAQDIVTAARRQADALKTQMHEQIEAARAAGYEAGMQQGRADFAASVAATVAEMETAFSRLELRIVNTVMGGLQQVLGRLEQRSVMEQLVRRVLNEARDRKQLRLRVSALQYDAVNDWLGALIKDYPHIEFIDVVKDPHANVGTCVLESEFGAIDASLDVQLAAVRRGLLRAFVDKRVAAAAGRE